MIEVPLGGLQQLTSDEKIVQLKNLAVESFDKITAYQHPNGLIPASLGRFDDNSFRDENFNGRVWVKDNVRAVKFALDPSFQKYFPELNDLQFIKEGGLKKTAQELYLSAIQGILLIQSKPEQMSLFSTRPNKPRQDGYSTINEHKVPAIKFEHDGKRVDPWGHNQPDNWGTLLLESGKGIEQGFPVLQNELPCSRADGVSKQVLVTESGNNKDNEIAFGDILQHITSYVAHLKTERLVCRSLWERNEGWSSYSTRRIVLAGLEQMSKVWEEIVLDSKSKGYGLHISKQQIGDAAGSLEEKVKEHFPADYTNNPNHFSRGDLASIIVAHDLRLPPEEVTDIIRITEDLKPILKYKEEKRVFGYKRYIGDDWKQEFEEALWIMGIIADGKREFDDSFEYFIAHFPLEGYKSLYEGLRHLETASIIKNELTPQGDYIPELLIIESGENIPFNLSKNLVEKYDKTKILLIPNNNDLAWTRGYHEETLAAAINTLTISQRLIAPGLNYYLKPQRFNVKA